MPFEFKIIPENQIETVVPLVLKMSKPSITEAVLSERFKEMVTQNYECVGVYDDGVLIGVFWAVVLYTPLFRTQCRIGSCIY